MCGILSPTRSSRDSGLTKGPCPPRQASLHLSEASGAHREPPEEPGQQRCAGWAWGLPYLWESGLACWFHRCWWETQVPGSETKDSMLLMARAAAVCAGPCILFPWMTPAHTACHVTGEEPSLTSRQHGAPEGTGTFLQGVPNTQLSSWCLAPQMGRNYRDVGTLGAAGGGGPAGRTSLSRARGLWALRSCIPVCACWLGQDPHL